MPLHEDDPSSIGGYRLVDRLGAGGMGVVYWGRSRSGRDVAVKVIHSQYAADPVFRTRFRQEIEAVRRVSGAFTAPVVDADPEAPRPWMATQYVTGHSLAQRIREGGALRGYELRRLALGLVEALRDIHRAGVVHRDLKPANVLMAEDGPRVIDFGISRAAENQTLTTTGQMIGTPPFMSPEQLTEARTVGPASDVFSLGALLVYAATGRGPFDTDSPYLTAYRVVHDEPVLDGLPQPLREVLERCLLKDAGERPGLDRLAREFAAVLPGPGDDDPVTMTIRQDGPAAPDTSHPAGRTTATGERAGHARRRPRRRLRPLWAASGTVGALAVGLTAYLLVGPGRAEDAGTTGGVPDGWQPWRTTVAEPAANGARKALDGRDPPKGGSDCEVYEGSVYCAGDRTLPVRLDARTGRTLWRADIAPEETKDVTYTTSLLGIHDSTVVVRETTEKGISDGTTTVTGLDARSGERLWRYTAKDDRLDVVLAEGLVVMPGKESGDVVARAARTGAARWTARVPQGYLCGFGGPAAGLHAMCLKESLRTNDTLLVRFDPADGTLHRTRASYDSAVVGLVGGRALMLEWEAGADAVVGTEYTPFTRLVDLDARTGERRTTELPGRPYGHATLAGGTLWFVSSNGRVSAVAPQTGKQLWQTRTSLEQPGPVTYDESTGVVHLASASGRVAALDARTGKALWETLPAVDRVPDDSFGEPEVLLYEGALVVPTRDGGVFSLDPADPERQPASG